MSEGVCTVGGKLTFKRPQMFLLCAAGWLASLCTAVMIFKATQGLSLAGQLAWENLWICILRGWGLQCACSLFHHAVVSQLSAGAITSASWVVIKLVYHLRLVPGRSAVQNKDFNGVVSFSRFDIPEAGEAGTWSPVQVSGRSVSGNAWYRQGGWKRVPTSHTPHGIHKRVASCWISQDHRVCAR